MGQLDRQVELKKYLPEGQLVHVVAVMMQFKHVEEQAKQLNVVRSAYRPVSPTDGEQESKQE